MARWRLSLFRMAWLCFLLCITASAGQDSVPKLTCSNPVFAFGTKSDTEDATHVFSLRNEGTAPLTIKKVHGCCGATTTLAAKSLGIGEKTTLRVVMDLHGRSGELRKSIYVVSDDPKTPHLRLELRGTIKKAPTPIMVRPERLDFGIVPRENVVVRSISLLPSPRDTFQVLEATCTNSCIGVEAVALGGTRGYELKVSTILPLPLGVTRSVIEVRTDHSKARVLQIPVSLRASSSLVVVPKQLDVVVDPKRTASLIRYVAIRSRKPSEFSILGVDLPRDAMAHVVQPMGKWGYRVKISGIKPSDTLAGQTVSIHTDVDDMEEVVIPFSVIMAGADDR